MKIDKIRKCADCKKILTDNKYHVRVISIDNEICAEQEKIEAKFIYNTRADKK